MLLPAKALADNATKPADPSPAVFYLLTKKNSATPPDQMPLLGASCIARGC